MLGANCRMLVGSARRRFGADDDETNAPEFSHISYRQIELPILRLPRGDETAPAPTMRNTGSTGAKIRCGTAGAGSLIGHG